ncbi:MAG: MFS transporter [Acidimicrobiia bacterium]|nr:MFS transporter [Acidimicrobiia bacterium]
MGEAVGDPTTSPVRQLLGDRNFRTFWIAQVLYAGVNGTLRFTFIWLVVTLTDWPSAEGLVAIALGLPAMVLSVPAGAWSDRVDRKRLFVIWTAATVFALAAFTALIATGRASTGWAGVAALMIGTTVSINMPNIQAIVPLLVPPERLMNAAALQNGGGQAASFAGLALGGVAIDLFGDAGGFGLLTVATFGALALMVRVDIPTEAESRPDEHDSMAAAITAGARFGLGREPLRTLLLLSILLGGSFSVMQVSMPRVVDEVYGRSSTAAGVVLGAFGVGMLASSAAVAGRASMRHGVNVARYIGVGLGLGQFLLSLAANYWVAIVVMAAWGVNAGVAMASHRTLMQSHTPPEMMGRVMGLMMLGFVGALPIGALVSSLLAPLLGPVLTMRWVGLATIGLGIALTWRRSIVDLR